MYVCDKDFRNLFQKGGVIYRPFFKTKGNKMSKIYILSTKEPLQVLNGDEENIHDIIDNAVSSDKWVVDEETYNTLKNLKEDDKTTFNSKERLKSADIYIRNGGKR